MEALIEIETEKVEKVIDTLSGLLADEFILYVQTRIAHWNVEGPHFYYLHKLFEEQYEMIADVIDDVAERIRAIGHLVPATVSDCLRLSHLTEPSNRTNDDKGLLKDLLSFHESIIAKLGKYFNKVDQELNDAVTTDLITRIMVIHDKMAWILRSHLR